MAPTSGFYLHPASPLHDTGWSHPEHQGRLRALASTVGRDLLALHGHVEQMGSAEAELEDVLRVHSQAHVRHVQNSCELAESTHKLVSLDPDTKVSPATWEAALGSAGTAILAARDVAEGRLSNAFVATRPPGHHATPTLAMGFCLFNNVAVTARWLQEHGHAERVLIVDWDVHHGNGTQDVFYDDPTVHLLSLHQAPHFPGTGAADETGSGKAEGTTLNVPLPAGTPVDTYRDTFSRALKAAAEAAQPDFVLVSAGMDCLKGDPLGDFLLEPEDLYEMTCEIGEVAARHCHGKVVTVLEGGYDPPRLGQGAVHVIRALAGLEKP